MSVLRHLILLGAVGLLCGCVSSSPAVKETVEAGDFLFALHQQGRLPGDTRDMHGKLTSEVVPLSEVVSCQEVFPISRTFHVAIKGESFTNNYTVVKLSKDSSWQLKRAWRIDPDGHITEWPVK